MQWKPYFYYWYCEIIRSSRTLLPANQNTDFPWELWGKIMDMTLLLSFGLCDVVWPCWRFMWLFPSNANLEPSECWPLNIWGPWQWDSPTAALSVCLSSFPFLHQRVIQFSSLIIKGSRVMWSGKTNFRRTGAGNHPCDWHAQSLRWLYFLLF